MWNFLHSDCLAYVFDCSHPHTILYCRTGANGSGNGLNARLSSAGSALAGILEEAHLRTSSINEAELAHDLKEVRDSVGGVGGIGYVAGSDEGSVGGDSGKSGGATPKSEHSLVSSQPVTLDP